MKILFVCTGNICRSPTAEGVARRWLAKSSHSSGRRANNSVRMMAWVTPPASRVRWNPIRPMSCDKGIQLTTESRSV